MSRSGRAADEQSAASARTSAFELAVLGLLAESPMHGYELRQRLSSALGSLRMLSYGSLYPMLRRLQSAGRVNAAQVAADPDAVPLSSRRSRVVYRISADGKERLANLLADAGPQSWSDDGFEVHLAFFHRTGPEARMRILEGRRRRVEERRENLRSSLGPLGRAAGRMDEYTAQLRRLGLEATEREVRWLDELISQERAEHGADAQPAARWPTGTGPTAGPTAGAGPPVATGWPADPPDKD